MSACSKESITTKKGSGAGEGRGAKLVRTRTKAEDGGAKGLTLTPVLPPSQDRVLRPRGARRSVKELFDRSQYCKYTRPKKRCSNCAAKGDDTTGAKAAKKPVLSPILEQSGTPVHGEEVEEQPTSSGQNLETPQPNGFERGLKVEAILAALDITGDKMFLVKFHEQEQLELIPLSTAKSLCPYLVVAFYEARLRLQWSQNASGPHILSADEDTPLMKPEMFALSAACQKDLRRIKAVWFEKSGLSSLAGDPFHDSAVNETFFVLREKLADAKRSAGSFADSACCEESIVCLLKTKLKVMLSPRCAIYKERRLGAVMICNHLTCIYGVCVNESNTAMCKCVDGYYGRSCDLETNECASNPCKNGGTCIDRIASFSCRCKPPYTGATCERLILKSLPKLRVAAQDDGYIVVAVAMLILLFMAVVTAVIYWCSKRRRTTILRAMLIEELRCRLRGRSASPSTFNVYLALSEDARHFGSPFFSPLTSDQKRDIVIADILESAGESSGERKDSSTPNR